MFQGFSIRKQFTFKEKYKVSVRVDAHNLPFKTAGLHHAQLDVHHRRGSVAQFGSMSGTMGAWSNMVTTSRHLQLVAASSS